MMIAFRELKTEAELATGYEILRELRTTLSADEFRATYAAASAADGYELWGAYEDGQCVGVMGWRVLFDFVHGKHLYIDDLVVTAKLRSRGVGAAFLKHAESLAEARQCKGLRLSTGIANDHAKRFYEREGWALRSVTFKKRF